MARSKFIFSLAFLIIFFSSCKNDLKLNAPYKEVPSIYAVLNPQDPIQMIRINKVFLGEGDANAMAQVADSVNYPENELEVKLERYVNGIKTNATSSNNGHQHMILFRDSVIQTSEGAFNSTQRVYVTSDRLYRDGEYALTITNKRSNNVFTARSPALDSIKPSQISPFTEKYYPLLPGEPCGTNNCVKYDKPQNQYSIKYAVNDAVIYQLTMRLHYIDSLLTGQNQYAYVDFVFPRQNKKDAAIFFNMGPFINNAFTGSSIYETVAAALEKSSVPVSSLTGRRMYKAQFLVYSSTQDYLDYLSFTAPSLSIAQDKPLYSNFDERKAIGIFTFRSRHSIYKAMDSEFISQFAHNPNTCKYKFFTSDLVIPFCP